MAKEFTYLWRNKWLTADAKSIDEMFEGLRDAAARLKDMRDAGITLRSPDGVSDDYAWFVTTDPDVASQFGFVVEEDEEEEEETNDEVIPT